MLVNDHSSVILPTTQNRSAVVMAILHSIFFDCTTFEELIERRITVSIWFLHIFIQDAPVYIHIIYAPDWAERSVIF